MGQAESGKRQNYRLLAHGFLTPTAVASYIVRVLHGASSAEPAQARAGAVLAHTRWVGARLCALCILVFNECYGGHSGCSARRQHDVLVQGKISGEGAILRRGQVDS